MGLETQAILVRTCPENIGDLAEEYCFARLPGAEAEALETHVFGCPACAQAVEEVFSFIDIFRAAAKRLKEAAPVAV